jgi:hypothetical protein
MIDHDELQELLRTDLHDHADHLGVPEVPTAAVLDRGRRLHRRRRIATGAGAIAATVALGGSLLLALPTAPERTAPDPASTPDEAAVFAVGSHVYIDGTSVDVPGTVHSLHYTSEGVLVRSNAKGGISDGSGPEHLTLVGGDGRALDLGEVPEGFGPATDPTLPYYALAEERGDQLYAIVRDVATGQEVRQLALPEHDWGSWDAPPLALSGDVLYVDYLDEEYAVDWRTGEEVGTTVSSSSVTAGRTVSGAGRRSTVLDARTGETLLSVTRARGEYGWFSLSPDGAHAMLFIEETRDGSEVTETDVYDVATGTHVTLAGAPWDLGWTRDGHLYRVDDDLVTTCSPVTGGCTRETVAITRVPEPAPVEHTETTCDKHGKNCGTMTWTETPDEPDNKVTLAGRGYES